MTSPGKFGEDKEMSDEGWKKMKKEMKEKNQKILERYAEVENDKKTAELQNSSVTTCNKRKEKTTYNQEEKQITREWDKEKFDMERDDDRKSRRPYKNFQDSSRQWNVSKDRAREQRVTDRSYHKNDRSHYYSHYSDRRKDDNWRHRPSEKSHQNSFRSQTSPKRTRGIGYRHDSYKKYADEKYKKYDNRQSSSGKKYSHRGYSRSSSKSMSETMDNQCPLRTFNLWQNDKSCDTETKHHSIVKWVTSVNKSHIYSDPKRKKKISKELSSPQEEKNKKPYNKFDRIKLKNFSDKSSDEEDASAYSISVKKKLLDSSKQASQPTDFKDSLNQNINSMPVKKKFEFERKGVQTKRGLTMNSSSSSIKDIDNNCRKQRRFNPNESKKIDYKNKHKTYEVYGPWRKTDQGIEDNKNTSLNPRSNLNTADTRHEDDGVWGDTDQNEIHWNLSDQEKGFQGTKTSNKLNKDTDLKNSTNDNDTTQREITKVTKKVEKKKDVNKAMFDENFNKKNITIHDDDGMWGNIDQADVKWKLDLDPSDSKINSTEEGSQDKNSGEAKEKYQHKRGDISDEGLWEGVQQPDVCELQSSEKSSSQVVSQGIKKKNKAEGNKFNTVGGYISSINNAYLAECHPSSANALQLKSQDNSIESVTNSFKKSVCITNKRNNFSEQPILSDDGEWSTLSEDNEIH